MGAPKATYRGGNDRSARAGEDEERSATHEHRLKGDEHGGQAEDQAQRRQPLHMRDWRAKLNAFLRFNEREILDDAGKVSMEVAQSLALEEYEKFSERRLLAEAAQADREFDGIAKQIESKAKARKGLPPSQRKRQKKNKKRK